MRITNIDAPKDLVEIILDSNIQEYILDVMRPLERRYCDNAAEELKSDKPFNLSKIKLPLFPIRKFLRCGYDNVAALLHTIPIYLRESKPKERSENDGIIDLLGAYIPNPKGEGPYIELYLKTIIESSNEYHIYEIYEPTIWLFTLTLIHELAHAALDIYNLELKRQIEKICYTTVFGRWREESMANAVTLRIIKESRHRDFYDYAHYFMLNKQPPEYALGVMMEKFEKMDFISVMASKAHGVHTSLQNEWLKYVKGNPTWKGLQEWNRILNSRIVYLFEGKYYTFENKLTYDIVNKVLSDYEKTNGEKMSCCTFKSIFPSIKTWAGISYVSTRNENGYTNYGTKLELKDGTIFLYNEWRYNTLHKFIANANVNLTEFKNY